MPSICFSIFKISFLPNSGISGSSTSLLSSTVENRSICPETEFLAALAAPSMTDSYTRISCDLLMPSESKQPHCMSDSSDRLFISAPDIRSAKSPKLLNGPFLLRSATKAAIRFLPTFFIADRPNRMPSSSTRKFSPLLFISGGSRLIPISSQFSI